MPISGRENDQKNDNPDASSASVPPVPPRRKSQDKLKMENKENVDKNKSGFSETVIKVRFLSISIVDHWMNAAIGVIIAQRENADDNDYFLLHL